MGVLPLILLGLLAQVYAGPGDNAFDIGNSRWGWDLVVTTPPRECAPMNLWYNVSAAGGIPDFSVLPDHAAVDFLTPDSAEDVWMTLRPPMGQGILSWTVPLRAGKQFLIRNHQGYKTVVTVGTPTDGTSCGQDAAQVTGTSSFGELRMATFNRLRSQTYASYSIADSSQFRSTSFPSGGTVRNVPLGAAVPGQTTPVKEPANEPSEPTNPSPDPDDGDNGGGTTTTTPGGSTPGGTTTTQANNANGTPAVPSGGTSSNGFAAPTSPVEQQGDNASSGGSKNSNSNSGSSNNGSSGNGESTDDSQAKQPSGDNDGNGSNDKSGGGSNIGAIIGGILGALLAGVLIGVLCVCLHRRRRRQRRFAAPLEVHPIPPPMAESSESIAATGGAFSGLAAYDTAVYASDSKNAALFTDDDEPSRSNRDSLGTTTAVLTETRRSFFGGLSDVPSSDQQSRIEESDNGTLVPPPRAAVPPPKYSRFG